MTERLPMGPEKHEGSPRQTQTIQEFRRQFLSSESITDSTFVLLDRSRQPILHEGVPTIVRVRREDGATTFNVAGLEVPYISLLSAVRDIAPAAVYVREEDEDQIPESPTQPSDLPAEVTPPEKEDRLVTFPALQQEVRGILGDLTEEEWNKAQNAFADLRREIDTMQWFEMGPNSVGAEKEGQRWNQLVLAPRDSDHRRELEEILAELRIYPWPEVQHNVTVLVVESPRDIALLSAGFIFDYLVATPDRHASQRALEELRERQRIEAQEAHKIFERERLERERLVQMDLETEEFRRQTKQEREERLALAMNEIFHIISRQESFEPPASLPEDQYYQFGYPRKGRMPRPATGMPRQRIEAVGEAIDSFSLDVDVEQIEEDFRTGRLNEDTLQEELIQSEIMQRPRVTPDLTLFPKKYEWIPPEKRGQAGLYRERGTQHIITDTDIEHIVEQAQVDDPKIQHAAIRELSLIHRQLILYAIRALREVYPSADPDDLFQGALMGLTWAAGRYEKRPEGNFKKYLMPSMEGIMRRTISGTLHPIRTPEGVPSERKKIFDTERALRAQNPDKAVEPLKVAQVLQDQGILKEGTSQAYDAFLRRVLWNFERVDPAVLEQEDIQLHDVNMSGEPLVSEETQLIGVERSELQQRLSRVLLTLSPREERTVRRYFELGIGPGQTAEAVYARLASELNVSELVVQRKIRDLTAVGDLTKPDVVKSLSSADREFVARYIATIESVEDATLESVAQEFGVSRERIRQIILHAFRRIRHPSHSRVLRQFLGD